MNKKLKGLCTCPEHVTFDLCQTRLLLVAVLNLLEQEDAGDNSLNPAIAVLEESIEKILKLEKRIDKTPATGTSGGIKGESEVMPN